MTPVEALAEKLTKWYCEANYPVHGKWIGKMINDLSQYLSDHASELFEVDNEEPLEETLKELQNVFDYKNLSETSQYWRVHALFCNQSLPIKLKGEN